MRIPYALMIFAAGVCAAFAQDMRSERVTFEAGSHVAHVEGSIKGYEVVDYIVSASKGQYMNVSMATKNTSTYFNIRPPNSDGTALFVGSRSGNQFEGTAPESGDYAVRVYMMRNAARRGKVADYRLELIVGSGDKDPRD